MPLNEDHENVALLPADDALPAAKETPVDDRLPDRLDEMLNPAESPHARLSLVDVACMTVALALLSGLAESAHWAFRVFVQGKMLAHLHPHLPWMAPVTMAAFLAAPGVVLAVVARRTRRRTALFCTALTAGTLAWINVLCLVRGLTPMATLMLALGLAAVVARLSVRWPNGTLRTARIAACALVVVVASIAAVKIGMDRYREHAAVAALPPAGASQPNVLLLVLDTVRADAVDTGAGSSATPNLARLAASGVSFDRAVAPSPWTLPSHAAMFTGRSPGELSADWASPLDRRDPTLAETLSARGYLTAGFVANTPFCSRATGIDRGFAHYEGYGFSLSDFVLASALGRRAFYSRWLTKLGHYRLYARKPAEQVNGDFVDWLSQRDDNRPYFAFLNYFDAHHPYLPEPPWDGHHPESTEQGRVFRDWWWEQKIDLPPETVARAERAYRDCVRGLDRQVGRLLDRLERRGELDNTLVIAVSDHGEHFGEHDLYLHGNSLYQPLLHVPLIVSHPGRIPAGRRVATPVGIQSLAATIVDFTDPAGPNPMPGNSLVRHWKSPAGGAASPSPVIAELIQASPIPPTHGRSPAAAGRMRSVQLGRMKYILGGDGAEELYDLTADPEETRNLLNSRRHRAVLDRCRGLVRDGREGL